MEAAVSHQYECLRCEDAGDTFRGDNPDEMVKHLIGHHQIPESSRAKQRCVGHADGVKHYHWIYILEFGGQAAVRTTVSIERTGEDAALWESMEKGE